VSVLLFAANTAAMTPLLTLQTLSLARQAKQHFVQHGAHIGQITTGDVGSALAPKKLLLGWHIFFIKSNT